MIRIQFCLRCMSSRIARILVLNMLTGLIDIPNEGPVSRWLGVLLRILSP